MNGNQVPAGLEKLPRRVWTYERDARGLVVAARSLGGWVVRVHREAHSRWQELRDAISLVARFEYDDFGDETAVRDAEGVITVSRFDGMHRPLAIAHNGSAATRYQYDGLGHLTERISPGQQRDAWHYNQYGRLVARTNAHGHAVRMEYDSEGRMTALTNRVGERLEWRHDIQGRIIEEKLFDGRVQRYEYDVMGRRVKVHLSDGRLVEQRFDPAGRLIARECSDGLTEQFAYDKEGRTIKAWNNHDVVELRRDRFGRIVAEIQNDRRVQYKYDGDGNRIGRRLPFDVLGSTLTRVFDVRGRLVLLADERGPYQEFRWDNLDRLVERRCAGGVNEVFAYDAERRLRQHSIDTRHGHLGRAYTYDVSGNLVELEDNRRGTLHYTYDRSNRLVEVGRGNTIAESYEYDANDALRATHRGPRRVDPGGKVVHDGSRELVYGKDGSVIEMRAGQSIWSLRHDVNGRLVEVVRPDRTVVTYEYDPFGRRTAKNVGDERTEFLWEGWALAAEMRDGRPQNIYVALDLRPLAQWHRGERLTPTLDHRAAVQEVFDETGRLRWSGVLDAYGNLLSQEGPTANPFRLRGQYEDAETGLHYNFHRHYDPVLADYTAPDPIGLEGGYHFYAYPRNPLRWDDPFGLECVKDEEGNPLPSDHPDHPKEQAGPSAVANPPEPEPPGKSATPSEAELRAKAEQARDDLAAKLLDEGKKPATVVGAYDPTTGEVTAAATGAPPESVDPQLSAKAEPLGGVGTKTDCGNTVGCCSEFHAANDLAGKGSDADKIKFTDAVRPRDDKVIPPCDNCNAMFPDGVPGGGAPPSPPGGGTGASPEGGGSPSSAPPTAPAANTADAAPSQPAGSNGGSPQRSGTPPSTPSN